jgi:Holliday junction resolvase-like predicted endonuclease
MVDAEKLRRLYRAAENWLSRNPAHSGLDYRFEVVAVRPGGLERRAV